MPLTQLQQRIFDDLKDNGLSTPKAIAQRINHKPTPDLNLINRNLWLMMESDIVQSDGFGHWKLTTKSE